MSVRERASANPADSVDLSATLELLAQLTQYAEAGAVQPHTLAQAAQHALDEHGDHVEVLVAVAKLHLATGQREAASRVLGRAARLFPDDTRVEQLRSEAGLETTKRAPLSESYGAQPRSGARPFESESESDEPTYDTSIRRRTDPREDEGPGSERTPVSLRGRDDTSGKRTRPAPPPSKDMTPPAGSEPAAPTTPRPSAGPTLRPTVKMPRVAGAPERQRWGKAEGREPFDSRPAFDSRPDREPSEGPRSVRFPASQRGVSIRDHAPTPASPMPRVVRDAGPRTGRAATGNLKLLDPGDERRHLDRYELIGEIASGGMASVFLARLGGVAGFQRFFAIKRLHPHLADEQEFIDMFLDEARLAAGIHHPNVVPILEVGTSDAGYYLVMDYIEGDTLSGVIARASAAGSLPRPIALRIVLDALHGLHAAHELTDAEGNLVDLVHRDCSPQNILVGIDGSSRITDFGVARASSRLSTTRTATVKGKLAYLSPEQATGRALDRRSDLFGMGVILWEVLAGRRLFRADSEGATLSRILVEPIPPVSDYAPDIPQSVAEVVAIALARDPGDRFATAGDMADALEETVRDVATPELFIASPRDVGGYMRELFGDDITARRDAVRAWIVQCGEAGSDGPRSQGIRRGAASPPAPSVRARVPSTPDPGDDEDDEVDSEVPSTKKEASILRAEEASRPSMRAQPVPVKIEAAPALKADPPAEAEAAPATEAKAAPASERATSSAAPTVPEAPSPLRKAAADKLAAPASKRPPLALIALTLLLVLAALAVFAVRSLG